MFSLSKSTELVQYQTQLLESYQHVEKTTSELGNRREKELESQIERMQAYIQGLELKQRSDKTFVYMVIHDLKHPLESVMSQIELISQKV